MTGQDTDRINQKIVQRIECDGRTFGIIAEGRSGRQEWRMQKDV